MLPHLSRTARHLTAASPAAGLRAFWDALRDPLALRACALLDRQHGRLLDWTAPEVDDALLAGLVFSDATRPSAIASLRARCAQRHLPSPRWLPCDPDTGLWLICADARLDADPTARDLFDHLTACAALRLREARAHLATRERLTLLSQVSLEGLLIHHDGRVIDVNDRFADVLGCSPDALRSADVIARFVDPDARDEVRRRVRDGVEGTHTLTIHRLDGTPTRVELEARQGLLGDTPVRVVAVRDISRRERNQHLLRESEQRLRSLVSATFDAVVVSDDGVITEVAGDHLRLLGWDADDLVARPALDLVVPAQRPRAAAVLARNRFHHGEVTLLHRDGSTVPARAHGVPIGHLHLKRRITGLLDLRAHKRHALEREALERRALQLQRLESLSVLAGGIAHDFNNLLVGVLGNAELLADHVVGPDAHALLDDISRAATKATSLTTQMLAYAGRGRFTTECVALRPLIHGVLDALAPTLPPNVRLPPPTVERALRVQGDPLRLAQVVQNIIINAIEAIADHPGAVRVSARVIDHLDPALRASFGAPPPPDGPWALIEVRDDGPGMDDDTLQRIFDPFFSTRHEGHGLGLAAALGIVRAHGGVITAESAPDLGALFRVLLPGARHSSTQLARLEIHAVSHPHDAPPPPRRVLIVDDEDLVRRVARLSLERKGFVVLEAVDGVEAIACFEREHDALSAALVDLSMPNLDGPEVIARFSQINPRVPVLLASGYASPDVEQRLQDIHHAGFLRKPFTPTQLVAAIEDAIKRTP